MTQNLVPFQATCHSLILLKVHYHFHNMTVFKGTSPGRQDHPMSGMLLESPQVLLHGAQSPPTLTKVFQGYTVVMMRNMKRPTRERLQN